MVRTRTRAAASLCAAAILILFTTSTSAQTAVAVSGAITDVSGATLSGATVETVIAGRAVASTVTAEAGRYRLDVPAGVPFEGTLVEGATLLVCLVLADRHGEVSVDDLTAALGVAPSTASRQVTRAVQAGMVDRGVSAADPRRAALSLTAAGRQLVREAREFIEAHRKEFPGAPLSYHSAAGYGGCQVLAEAIRRAGSLDPDKIRMAILNMNLNTVYGGFKVDKDGVQTAHTMLTFQWQDGKKVIVWPDELAPGKPRFPTPPWSQRQ